MKITAKYDNPYEAAYSLLKNNPYFREEDWDTYANRGELDQYVDVLSQTDKLPSYTQMNKEWDFDLMDSDRRLLTLSNELIGDRTNIDTEREIPYFDEETQTEKTRKENMSDYDYNKMLLRQYRDLRRAQDAYDKEVQRKKEMSGWIKFGNSLLAIGAETATGIATWLDDIGTLLEAVGNEMTGKRTFREVYQDPHWRFSDEFVADVQEWEARYSGIRDLDGRYTPIGKVIGGVSFSLGEALPTIALGLIGSSLGKAGSALASVIKNQNVAQTIAGVAAGITNNTAKAATALYYIGMGSGTAREIFNDPNMASVPTYKIILNASIKTAVEYLIQKGVSKAFGSTMLDHMMFGENVRAMTGKSLFIQGLKRIGHDAVSEGVEELLQQYSNYFVDRFFMIDEHNFGQLTDWNVLTALDAFFLGAISAVSMNVQEAIISNNFNKVFDKFAKPKQIEISREQYLNDEYLNLVRDPAARQVVRDKFNARNAFTGKLLYDTITVEVPPVYRAVYKNGKAINAISAREFQYTVGDLVDNYNRLLLSSPDMRKELAEHIYASMRTIASVFYEMGQERFAKAEKLLMQMNDIKNDRRVHRAFNIDEMQYETIVYNNADEEFAEVLMSLDDVIEDMLSLNTPKLQNNAEKVKLKDRLKAKLKDAKTGVVNRVLHRRDKDAIKNIDDPQVQEAFSHIFNTDPDVDTVTTTEDGTTPVFDRATKSAFLPIDYVHNTTPNDITKASAEQMLVENTVNAAYLKPVLKKVAEVFRKLTHDSSAKMTTVVYNLFFNDTFQTMLLHYAPKDIYNLMAHLDTIEAEATRGSVKDAVYTKRIEDIKKQLAMKIVTYVIYQQEADYQSLTMLTKEQKDFVAQKRWSRDLANRITRGEKLSDEDINVLTDRVNNTGMSENTKRDMIAKFNSPSADVRKIALASLNQYYYEQFNSPYDGNTYLPDNTLPNVLFNTFMQQDGLTLKTLFKVQEGDTTYHTIQSMYDNVNSKTILAFRRDQFKNFTHGRYDFTRVKGEIKIQEIEAMNVMMPEAFNSVIEGLADVRNLEYLSVRYFVTPEDAKAPDLSECLNENYDKVSKSMVTLHDLIFNPEVLNAQTRREISSSRNYTPIEAFEYFRHKVLVESNHTTSIVAKTDGDFVFVNIQKMSDMFKSLDTPKQTENEVNISYYIKSQYLVGRLADVIVRLGDQSQYLPTQNIIEIDRNATDAELFFSIAHEFQHAIQVENNLNGGLDYEWIAKIPVNLRKQIIQDVKAHNKQFFDKFGKDADIEMALVNNIVYMMSGEGQAYGVEGGKLGSDNTLNYYPVIVRTFNGRTTITMSWGTKYDITPMQPKSEIKQSLVDGNGKIVLGEEKYQEYVDYLIKNGIYDKLTDPFYRDEEYNPKPGTKEYELYERVKTWWEEHDNLARNEFWEHNENKAELLSQITPAMREDQLKVLHQSFEEFRDIPYEKWLNMDIPFVRTQDGVFEGILPDDPYYSVYLGINGLNWLAVRTRYLITDTIPNVDVAYIGTVKPKDILAANPVYRGLHEALVSPDTLRKANIYQGRHNFDLSFVTIKDVRRINERTGNIDETKRMVEDTADYFDINQQLIDNEARNMYDEKQNINSLTGIIFPDGDIGFSNTEWSNETLYKTLMSKFAKGVDEYLKKIVEIDFRGNSNDKYSDIINIRINSNLNIDQKQALLDFVSDALAHGSTINVEHLASGLKATSYPGQNAEDLLSRLGPIWNTFSDPTMSMAQPGRSRRIKAEEHEKTNLRYFDKRKLIDSDLQDFIVNSNRLGLEPEVWNKIGGTERGTLTKTWLLNWFRDTDKCNDYTFKRINKFFFGNRYIKNFEELKFIEFNLRNFYALRVVLRRTGNEKHLYSPVLLSTVQKWINNALNNPTTREVFMDIMNRFDTYVPTDGPLKGQLVQLDINEADRRRAIMLKYDGTVDKAAYLGVVAKGVAILLFNHPKYKGPNRTISIDRNVNEGLSIADTIKDPDAQEAFNEVLNEMDRKQLIKAIYDYAMQQDYTQEQKEKLRRLFEENDDTWVKEDDADWLYGLYTELDLANTFNLKPRFKIDPDATAEQMEDFKEEVKINSLVKRTMSYRGTIGQFARTIRNNLPLKEIKKLPERVRELFDDDGIFQAEKLQNKTREELIDLETLFRDIADKAKRAMFEVNHDETLKKVQELEKELNQVKKHVVHAESETKVHEKVVVVGNTEFNYQSDVDMPSILQKILDVSFSKFVKTDVAFFSGENEVHMRMSYSSFLEENAETINGLTQGDVDAIIEFYANSLIDVPIVGDTSSFTKYNAFKLFLLATIEDMAKHGASFTLSKEQLDQINNTLKFYASFGATMLSTFQTVQKKLNPAQVIVQSMAKLSGLEFKEGYINQLIDAFTLGNIEQAREIRDRMYNDVLKQATTRKIRRGIREKILAFERMCMLSSPGTWMRNIFSNLILTAINPLSDVIGHAFDKVRNKIILNRYNKKTASGAFDEDLAKLNEKLAAGKITQKEYEIQYKHMFSPLKYSVMQYEITGTKVSKSVNDFVDTKIVNSGLLGMIRDGISKYDTRGAYADGDISHRLAKMIVRSVEDQVFSKVFDDTEIDPKTGKYKKTEGFKNKAKHVLGFAERYLSYALSDNPFINLRVKTYIKKMLMERNFDTNKGINALVEEVIVDAYVLASYEYMHKPNALSRFESFMRQEHPNVYFIWKQFMPFASASWNWFIEGLNYTPIGLAKGIIELNNIEKTIQKIEDDRQKGKNTISPSFTKFLALRKIGKGIIGSITTTVGLLLALFGCCAVDEEDDKVKLYIPGANLYIDIGQITGMQGVMLGIALGNPRKGNFEKAIYDVADTLLNDSILSSWYDAFRHSDNVGDFITNETITIAGMFVPNAIKAFNAAIQVHKVRYSPGIVGQLERYATSLIPGLSYAFPTYVDPYTGEQQMKYALPALIEIVNRFISPIKFYPYKMSDIEKEALDYGVTRGELSGRYEDIGALKGRNKTRLNEKYGELNKQALNDFFNNRVAYKVKTKQGNYRTLYYDEMTEEQRKNAIENIMNHNADYAKIYVYTTYMNGKYYASSSMYNTLTQLGITKNVYRAGGGKQGFAK